MPRSGAPAHAAIFTHTVYAARERLQYLASVRPAQPGAGAAGFVFLLYFRMVAHRRLFTATAFGIEAHLLSPEVP
jgi:hypothetical protein